MAQKKKKKKRSPQEMHRQIQDSLQVLPKYIEQQKKEGHPVKAFLLRYVTGPILRLMNWILSTSRYRGEEGGKRKQTEQMRRRIEQKQAAMRHLQSNPPKGQRRGKMR